MYVSTMQMVGILISTPCKLSISLLRCAWRNSLLWKNIFEILPNSSDLPPTKELLQWSEVDFLCDLWFSLWFSLIRCPGILVSGYNEVINARAWVIFMMMSKWRRTGTTGPLGRDGLAQPGGSIQKTWLGLGGGGGGGWGVVPTYTWAQVRQRQDPPQSHGVWRPQWTDTHPRRVLRYFRLISGWPSGGLDSVVVLLGLQDTLKCSRCHGIHPCSWGGKSSAEVRVHASVPLSIWGRSRFCRLSRLFIVLCHFIKGLRLSRLTGLSPVVGFFLVSFIK